MIVSVWKRSAWTGQLQRKCASLIQREDLGLAKSARTASVPMPVTGGHPVPQQPPRRARPAGSVGSAARYDSVQAHLQLRSSCDKSHPTLEEMTSVCEPT